MYSNVSACNFTERKLRHSCLPTNFGKFSKDILTTYQLAAACERGKAIKRNEFNAVRLLKEMNSKLEGIEISIQIQAF